MVWCISDVDDERGEENKQGEEEAADDEVKKWSEWSEWNAEALAMHKLNRTATAHKNWDAPFRKGVFEPPEMKA